MQAEAGICISQMSYPFMLEDPLAELLESLPAARILYHGIDNRNTCLETVYPSAHFKETMLLQVGCFAVLFPPYYRVRKAAHTQTRCLGRHFETSVVGSVI